MKKIPIAFFLLVSASFIGEALAASETPGFVWPLPSGWKKETIPFPLDFAPALKHDGVEELRFAPNFFKPEAPGYWSYAFVWWLKDKKTPDVAVLSEELTQYFKGLSLAVGAKKFRFEPARFQADLKEADGGYRGHADLYDAFTTGKPLSLLIEGRTILCPTQGRRAIMFLLSPKPMEDPIWKELRDRATSFRCSAKD